MSPKHAYRQKEDTDKNSCLYCGRTKEWHERVVLSAQDRAEKWMESRHMNNRVYSDLVLGILVMYIEDGCP